MTIKKKLLRTSSKGIEGTLANAEHHAQGAIPLVHSMVSIIDSLGKDYDFEWQQGNNVHVITRNDGSRLTFRPFINSERNWGIDVLCKFSRSDEIRLFAVTQISECFFFGSFLTEFLDAGININTYGSTEHNNNSRAEE